MCFGEHDVEVDGGCLLRCRKSTTTDVQSFAAVRLEYRVSCKSNIMVALRWNIVSQVRRIVLSFRCE